MTSMTTDARRRVTIACVSIVTALSTAMTPAQTPRLAVLSSSPISAADPRSPHAETFAAVNPRNPQNIVAASLAIESGQMASAVYFTLDGGRTWARARDGAGAAVLKGGDPIVYFDREGTAFFGAIQGTPIGFLLTRSTDGGRTWDPPVTVPGGTYDRQYLAFDATGGKFDGRTYASGAVNVQEMDGTRHFVVPVIHSTDGGRTFQPPKYIDAAGSGYSIFGIGDLVVAPKGELVVVIETYANKPNESPRTSTVGRLWTAVSEDGGLSFAAALPGPDVPHGRGAAWLKSMTARRAAIDVSNGPFRGRIYAAWVDLAGERYEVKVASTSDLGRTWTAPVRVNDNAGTGDPANVAVAVNRDGTVGVVFNDRRDDPRNDCYRFYVTASVDGGATFLPNTKVRDGETCPNAPGNWAPMAMSFLDLPLDLTKEARRPAIAMSGVPARFPNGGDTQGLVAAPDGTFHAVWINGESGVMQPWHTAFHVDPGARITTTAARTDHSRELKLDVSTPTIDFSTHTIAFDVRIENPLPSPVAGPLTVVLDDLQSALTDVRAANAENGRAGKGAEWTFVMPGDGALAPGAKSAARMFRFSFTGGVPDKPGEPLRAHFLILGRDTAAPKTR
jgi:hypothetical protein